MDVSYRRLSGIARGARWGLPRLGVLADGDDVRASFLARLTVRDGSDSCETSSSRLQYAGLNSWIGAEPKVTPCAEGGP